MILVSFQMWISLCVINKGNCTIVERRLDEEMA